MKLDPYFTPYTKNQTKMIKDLNTKLETIKFLGENTGKKLLDIGLGKDFSDMAPKAQATN